MKRFFPRPRLAGLLCALALPAWAAFTDNGNGTITDTTTGLVWDKCSRGQVWDNTTPPGTCTGVASTHTWAAALAEATAANSASHRGQADWRLPNRTELESLVQINAASPAIDGTYFPATPSNWYWTSTTFAPNPAYAWFVRFNDGNANAGSKTYSPHVRLVRSGQWFGAFDALAVAVSPVRITKTSDKSHYLPGDTASYTVTVASLGLSTVTGASLADPTPPGLSNAQWSCSPSGGAICPSPVGPFPVNFDLPGQGALTFTLSGTVTGRASLDNTATITPGTGGVCAADTGCSAGVTPTYELAPPAPVNPVPTLGAWALLALSAMLGGLAAIRRKTV